MRKLPWSVISIVAAAAVANVFIFAGCGSEESPAITDTDSGGTSTSGGASTSGGSSGTSSSGGSSGTVTDGAPQDGDIQDGQTCALAGQNCTAATASTCCSKICAADGKCAIAVPDGGGAGCFPTGVQCTAGPQCCSGSCIGGTCSATACKQDAPTAEACTANEQCCSGKCGASGTGVCQTLGGGTGCRSEGNACTANTQCCSGQCGANGKCINVSFCQQTTDVCANDFDCCSGNCVKQGADVLGRCGAPPGNAPCSPTGTICTGLGCDNKCCSLSCGPYGTTGVNICQPPSGCKPQDELCKASGDCCGGPGQPKGVESNGNPTSDVECKIPQGETFGRCDGPQCLRPGAVCKAKVGACGGTSNNCCEGVLPDGGKVPPGTCNAGNEDCCSRDALGIPRCRAVNFFCDAGTVMPGQLCATSADCCGKPCVNNKCEGTCVAKGGECTITADCCAPEECVVPTGATKGTCGGTILPDGGVAPPPPDSGTPPPPQDGGTCALYGQSCTMSSQCCNGVPCSGGICRFN